MHNQLRQKITDRFKLPVNTSKDCSLLSDEIFRITKRSISSTTLRRFFGLLTGKSDLSAYNLDTLAIYCGEKDYKGFCDVYHETRRDETPEIVELLREMQRITEATLNGISRKCLTSFDNTIARETINRKIDFFLESGFTLMPLIAPGGYGKSVALAHWVKSAQSKGLSVLFCSAGVFSHLISNTANTSGSLKLSKNSSGAFYQAFSSYAAINSSPLVLIIDGLDELNADNRKFQELSDNLTDTIETYHHRHFLKIILSMREASWYGGFKSQLDKLSGPQMMLCEPYSLESGYTNMPLLSTHELRDVIERHNSGSANPVIFDCLNPDVKQLIRIPIQLHLFLSVFSTGRHTTKLSLNQLIQAYLKEVVFTSKFAEEKEDILWKFLELLENNSESDSVPKNTLRNFYPIHLRREGNYYQAYADLTMHGILNEERQVNKYGLYTTLIRFKHHNFYHYLSALNYIRLNQGITHEVFTQIIGSSKDFNWKSQVTAILFESAYLNENIEALEHFCDLPEEILQSLPVRFAAGMCFRTHNGIWERLISLFAANPKAQTYFFEQFVDTNYLFNNYVFRIHEYLKHKSTPEARLFGNCILFLASFLKMDKNACIRYWEVINEIIPDNTIHPWPVGRKVASLLLWQHYISGNKIADSLGAIDEYKKIAYSYKDYLEFGLIAFELPVMVALALCMDYHAMEKMLKDSLNSYRLNKPDDAYYFMLSNHQNELVLLFLEYSKFKNEQEYDNDLIYRIEDKIDRFSVTYDDFQYLILLHFFLADLYWDNDSAEPAKRHFQSAFNLARFAGYDFFMAFLHQNDPKKIT